MSTKDNEISLDVFSFLSKVGFKRQAEKRSLSDKDEARNTITN